MMESLKERGEASCSALALVSATPATGQVDYHELKVAMRALGFEVKKQEARAGSNAETRGVV